MKKKKKIIFCLLLFVLIISFCCISHASGWGLDGLVKKMNPAKGTDPTTNSKKIGLIVAVFKALQYIGTGISIIVVMKLGISYMVSSIEQRAEIKKRAMPIVIGTILIVAAVNILGFVSMVISDAF